MKIPTMVTDKCLETIREYSRHVESGNIVEIGTFLGACTQQICLGLQDVNAERCIWIWCYDYFKCVSRSQVTKAKRGGVKLELGRSYYFIFKKAIKIYKREVRCLDGDIRKAKWRGGKCIALLIDDASKQKSVFDHVAKTFFL